MKRISLKDNKEVIASINYEDIIVITLAQAGAMGSAGTIEYVVKDNNNELTLYDFNYVYEEDIDFINTCMDIIPWFSDLKLFFGSFRDYSEEFEGDYLGFGNYIFLRKGKLFDYYKKHIKDFDVGDKYTNWDNIVENYYKEVKTC